MSYRPDDQRLTESLEAIQEGIDNGYPAYFDAVRKRIISNEWTEEHIQDIMKLNEDLMIVQRQIKKLLSETW